MAYEEPNFHLHGRHLHVGDREDEELVLVELVVEQHVRDEGLHRVEVEVRHELDQHLRWPGVALSFRLKIKAIAAR